MRHVLDRLYAISGGLAATFIVLICAVVSAQVVLNTIDKIASAMTGTGLGLTIPSYADFTGFFLASATFLALAYTLKRGAHIRVTLFFSKASAPVKKIIDMWSLGLCAAVSAYLLWWSTLLMLESLEYGDLSPGMIAVPLWIPQCALVAGLAILTIALIDELVTTFRTGAPSFHDLGEGLLEEDGDV